MHILLAAVQLLLDAGHESLVFGVRLFVSQKAVVVGLPVCY